MATAGGRELVPVPADRLDQLLESLVSRQLISPASRPAILRELTSLQASARGARPDPLADGPLTRELTVHLLRGRQGFGFAVADIEAFDAGVQAALGSRGAFLSFIDPHGPAGADGSLAVYDQVYKVNGRRLVADTAAEAHALVSQSGLSMS
mgnify:CR=1 FL=1